MTDARNIAVADGGLYVVDGARNIFRTATSGGTPTMIATLARPLDESRTFKVLGDSVYVPQFDTNTSSYEMVRVRTSTGMAEVLGAFGANERFTVGADNVVWEVSGGLARYDPAVGGAPQTLQTSATAGGSFAIDRGGEFVYWGDSEGSGRINRTPLAGGGFTTVVAQSGDVEDKLPNGISVGSDKIFWTMQYAARSCTAGCSSPTVVSETSGPVAFEYSDIVALDAGAMFLKGNSTCSSLDSCELVHADSSGLLTTLVSDPMQSLTGLTHDGCYAYWLAGDSVYRVSVP